LHISDRPVAEFSLSQSTAQYTLCPKTQLFQLTINSLIVADALSNLGPDFDLLVASHRDVKIETVSGSINISNPQSPASPQSPTEADFNPWRRQPQHPPLSTAAGPKVAAAAAAASTSGPGEPLINCTYQWIDESAGAGGGSGCPVQRIGVHFSELDIIANQKTLVELVSFAKRINPADTYAAKEEKRSSSRTGAVRIQSRQLPQLQLKRPEFAANCRRLFSRLHVLLVRVLDDPQQQRKSAKKVATVTLTGMQVTANHVDSSSFATASLASVSVLDLTNSSRLHRSIVWIGGDPSESTDERCPQREQVPLADELTLSR
uniref:VPS13_mid_rpt domain-containing protein n=1 Tax=Macrostomum lignano TaxID=282301 RepID=A0A1I8IGS5_9PLAT